MEDPGITRLDIDQYRRSLKLTLSDTERKEILTLLVAAELRMQNGFTSVPERLRINKSKESQIGVAIVTSEAPFGMRYR